MEITHFFPPINTVALNGLLPRFLLCTELYSIKFLYKRSPFYDPLCFCWGSFWGCLTEIQSSSLWAPYCSSLDEWLTVHYRPPLWINGRIKSFFLKWISKGSLIYGVTPFSVASDVHKMFRSTPYKIPKTSSDALACNEEWFSSVWSSGNCLKSTINNA